MSLCGWFFYTSLDTSPYFEKKCSSFTYDPIGNWQTETANGATTTFTANALNQYTTIANAKLAAPQNLRYDANGNMTSDGQGNSSKY